MLIHHNFTTPSYSENPSSAYTEHFLSDREIEYETDILMDGINRLAEIEASIKSRIRKEVTGSWCEGQAALFVISSVLNAIAEGIKQALNDTGAKVDNTMWDGLHHDTYSIICTTDMTTEQKLTEICAQIRDIFADMRGGLEIKIQEMDS